VPDAIGIALHDWFQDKQGVQQELIRQTPVGSAPAIEQVTVVQVAPSVTGEQLAFTSINEQIAQSFIGTCPDCGSQLEFAEGCVKCHVCGFSECG
jgi:ribonucleoside-diphosphate reductase alpha chain